MRPTRPATAAQLDDFEPVEGPDLPAKICPHCGKKHWHPYTYICGDAKCIAEEVIAPLKRWDREAIEVMEIRQAEAVAICEGERPCAKCGRRLIGPWETHARCEERHELEWEEANDG